MMASSLAFTSILSSIPILALGYFALDSFGGLDRIQSSIEGFVFKNLAPSFGGELLGYVETIRSKISGKALGIFGVLGFVVTGFSMLYKIEHSLTLIFRVEESRSWVRRLTNFWALLTLGPLLILTSIAIMTQTFEWLARDTGEIAKGLVFLAGFALPWIISTLMIAALYLIIPTRRFRIRYVLPAAALTAVLFEIAKQGYAFYASYAIGQSVYGSLAVLPIFLVWLQVVWWIVLFGAEVCYFLAQRFGGQKGDPVFECETT